MKNKNKIITLIIVISISVGGLVYKGYFTDEIYVLNEEENIDTNKDDIQNDEEQSNGDKSNDIQSEKQNDKDISAKEITVYISGEVNNPGIVTLKSDDRLADAVKILGGVTKKADMNNINLAVKLEDEMHYIIPKKGEKVDNSNQNSSNNITGKNTNTNNNQADDKIDEQNNNKVNINTASIQELDTIPGVGEATANKILSYREENGDFKSIEEIKNVNGIGDKKYENMKDLICVN